VTDGCRPCRIKRVALVTQDHLIINNHVKALKIEVARLGLTVADEQRFAVSR